MSEWKPIDTAPKNKRILLYRDMNRTYEIVVGKYKSQKYHSRPRPYWSTDTERIWGISDLRSYPPSHWQELPLPPKTD